MNRFMLTLMTAAGGLSLAACGSKTDTTADTANVSTENVTVAEVPAAPAASPGQTFANAAASSDAFEIATSKLAMQTSQSKGIKAFADKMVKAHTDSTAQLNTAAASASPAIVPDATLTPAQQDKLTALQAKTGADFDTAYAAEQLAAHQATLDALRTYAASPDVPALGAFATKLVPIVTAHLNMAQGLKP